MTDFALDGCGARISLAHSIIVDCDRGPHNNFGHHEGPLTADSVWRVRWSPIGSADAMDPVFVRDRSKP